MLWCGTTSDVLCYLLDGAVELTVLTVCVVTDSVELTVCYVDSVELTVCYVDSVALTVCYVDSVALSLLFV